MNGACSKTIKKFDYCGAGFSVIDAQFWAGFEILAARTPYQYRSVEDVASSKLLADMGWKRQRAFADITDMNYGAVPGKQPEGLWSALFMRARKTEFFNMLAGDGWRMQHNASVLSTCLSASKRKAKKDLRPRVHA